MALILGISKQEPIYIGDIPMRILYIRTLTEVEVEFNGVKFLLTDKEVQEVSPGVFISCGLPTKHASQHSDIVPRLVIEAPRSVQILRGHLYGATKKK